jgi:two-component system LytT family sensor kinase
MTGMTAWNLARGSAAGRAPAGGSRPRRGLDKAAWFWTLQCAGWIGFGVAMLAWGLEHWTAAEALVNKLILVAVGFALTLGCRWIYRRARARRRALPPMLLATLVGSLSFGGAALWIEAHYLLLSGFYAAANGLGVQVRPMAIQIGTLLYYGFVLLAWSLLYWGINAGLDLEEQRDRAGRAEALAHQARLRALRSQLEPHFLFNTLNAISTLVVEKRNSEAARMVARLSDFLRLTLETTDTPEVSVAEELEFVQRYLDIEQIRFGERLHVVVEASAEAMQASVPVLVLQPLVENAVKHGVLPREGGGRVAVTIGRDGELLRISVRDDGLGLAADPGARQGVGLTNTAARLAELYGESSRFWLAEVPGGGLEASLEIPFRVAVPRFDPAAAPGPPFDLVAAGERQFDPLAGGERRFDPAAAREPAAVAPARGARA